MSWGSPWGLLRTARQYHVREQNHQHLCGMWDYFGEMSFIDGAPRCATVETSRILKELSIGEYITMKKKIISINRELPYSW